MANLGELVLKLSTETAQFKSDMGKAAHIMDQRSRQMQRSMNTLASAAKAAFGIAVAKVSVDAMRNFTTEAISMMSALQGLSEETGTSVQTLARFQPIAKISGVELAKVGESVARLSKAFAEIDLETSKSTRALKFLGISAKDAAGQMRDARVVLNEIALLFETMEDNATKTALAIDLFGISGVRMLPFLKDLAENQNISNIATVEMVEAADAADKALARFGTQIDFLKMKIVSAMLPVLDDFIEALQYTAFSGRDVNTVMEGVANSDALHSWAEDSAIAVAHLVDVMRLLAETGSIIGSSFRQVGRDILAAVGLAQAFTTRDVGELRNLFQTLSEQHAEFNSQLYDYFNTGEPLVDQLRKRFDERRLRNSVSQSMEGSDFALDLPDRRFDGREYSNAAFDMTKFTNPSNEIKRALEEQRDAYNSALNLAQANYAAERISYDELNRQKAEINKTYLRQLRESYKDQATLANSILGGEAGLMTDKEQRQVKNLFEGLKRAIDKETKTLLDKQEIDLLGITIDPMQQEAFDKVIANLERLKSDETKILADRNRMIAALESRGVMTTRQAADARIAAQEDFADRFAAITFDQSRAAYRFFNDNQFRMRASEHRSLLEDDNLRFKAIEQNDQDVLVAKAARDAIEPQLKLKDLQQKILLLKEHTEGAQRKINTATKLGQVTQKDAMEFMEAALYDEARQLQAIRDELSALHLANPFDETIIRQLTDVDIKIEELRDSAAELREEFRSNHDAIAGMTNAFKDFAEKSTEHGRMFGEATTRAFNGMTEALTDFTMTGEADFKKLANSIVRDLIRIQVQSQIVGPISGVLGGIFGGGQATTPGYTGPMALANGGVMSGRGAMSLKSYAYGGIANSPQLALFGEGSTPEAFVPLPDGRRIPVVMSGNTGASNVVVNVNMESGQSAVTGDDGALLGKAVANAVQAELIKQKRPGGILS